MNATRTINQKLRQIIKITQRDFFLFVLSGLVVGKTFLNDSFCSMCVELENYSALFILKEVI
jgi:hypothetical protein